MGRKKKIIVDEIEEIEDRLDELDEMQDAIDQMRQTLGRFIHRRFDDDDETIH